MDPRPTPLAGVRVVEIADGRGEMCGRVLADLGADVVKVEPPGGCSARTQPPVCGGIGVGFALRNAGKRSVVADLAADPGRKRLLALLDRADIWLDAAPHGLDLRSVRTRNPSLVIVSMSDFGQTGPYRDWIATG